MTPEVPAAPPRRVRAAWTVLLLFAAGALVRLALLRIPMLWYDEATVGLMGLMVLRGELPVYFTGQPFMGSLDAYLAAPVYQLFGASAGALEAIAVLVALAWTALLLRLAWDAFGPRTALVAAAWLSLPPDYLLYWSHEGRPVYVLSLIFGTLALMLALRVPAWPPGRTALGYALIGAVLGLAFWENFLTLVYFPAVAVVLVARGARLHHLPAALAGIPGFFLGSLPHWLYGLPHHTAIPPPGGRIGLIDLGQHLIGLVAAAWPLLAGVPVAWRGTLAGEVTGVPLAHRVTPLGVVLLASLAVLYAAAVASGVRALRRASSLPRAAMLGLLVLAGTNLAVAVGTQYGRALGDDARYLVPLYAVLPIVLGRWLAGLPSRWAALAIAGLLLMHGADALTGSFRNLRPSVAAGQHELVDAQRQAIDALERAGITRLYAADFGTRVMTFLSRERVIFANHYEEIYPPNVRAVAGAERAGWWSGRDPVLEANLRALGVEFAYRPAGRLGGAYTDFRVSAVPLRELPPGRMTVTASHGGDTAGWMTDRDAATIWSTGRPKQGGEWFQVDLGAVEPVALVRWLPGTFQEVPSGLIFELSRDGVAWQRPIDLPGYMGPLYWSAGRPMGHVRSGRVELRVPPTPARFLRMTQTGRNALWAWTVRELFVYAAGGGSGAGPPPLDGPSLARHVRAAGVSRLYADHGWANRVALLEPEVRVPPANFALDAYNFTGAARDLLPPLRWEPGSGVLVEAADAAAFARVAGESGLGVRRESLGELVLFTYAPPAALPGAPVPSSRLTVTASRHPDRARRAVDGNPRTRWATGWPQTAGDWLRVDLAEPRTVAAVRLYTANPTDAARGLALEGTEDGVNWRPIAARLSTGGPLRWAGIGAVRDGVETQLLVFEPTRVRELRLTLTRGDAVFDWSVHELTVYAAK